MQTKIKHYSREISEENSFFIRIVLISYALWIVSSPLGSRHFTVMSRRFREYVDFASCWKIEFLVERLKSSTHVEYASKIEHLAQSWDLGLRYWPSTIATTGPLWNCLIWFIIIYIIFISNTITILDPNSRIRVHTRPEMKTDMWHLRVDSDHAHNESVW